MRRRIVLPLLSLTAGLVVALVTVAASRASQPSLEQAYVLIKQVAPGEPLSLTDLGPVKVALPSKTSALLISSAPRLGRQLAATTLYPGQLLYRFDVTPNTVRLRLVALQLKVMPPLHPGDLIDLFATAGVPAGGVDGVVEFAASVPVVAVTPSGVVVEVPLQEESAFIYASQDMALSATMVESGPDVQPAAPAVSNPATALGMAR